MSCCTAMKLVSYFQVNKFYRLKRKIARLTEAGAIKPMDIATDESAQEPLGQNANISSASLNKSISSSSQDSNTSSASSGYGDEEDILIESKEHTRIDYPQNLTLVNLYYFIALPTLCYEINFPRSDRIRKRFLIRRVCEIVNQTKIIIDLF
jgi:hypothetical protein